MPEDSSIDDTNPKPEGIIKPLSFEFIVATVVALVNFALDQADIHIILITWVSLLVCPALLIDGLRRTQWAGRVGWKSKKFILASLVVCFAFGLFGYYLSGHKRTPDEKSVIPQQATAHTEPHISAQLIVDSSKPKNTNYRLVIENGAIEISNVAVSVRSDQGNADFSPSPRQDMLPMSREEFPGPPIFNNLRPLSLEFIVTFDAQNQGRFARFTFLVTSKTVSSQPYFPTGSEEGLGDGWAKEDSQNMPLRQFIESTGTISLTFPEIYPDGSPNQMFLKANNRQLLINPVTREVAIQALFPSGKKLLEQPFLADKHTESGTHILTAIWDDRKQTIGLSVDGSKLVIR